MTRQLPRTSYGYLPPRGARAKGWDCPGKDCDEGDWHTPPRRWPYPCPECGTPADPVLASPWSHEAEGHKLRHILASRAGRDDAIYAEVDYRIWLYQDARLRGNPAAAAAARAEFRQLTRCVHEHSGIDALLFDVPELVYAMLDQDDLDAAAEEILAWHPLVETDDLEEDHRRRQFALTFVSCCIIFLKRPRSIGHPLESAVLAALADIRRRAESELTYGHQVGFKEFEHLRRGVAEAARLDEEKRLLMATGGAGPGLADLVRRRGIRRIFPNRDGSPAGKRIRWAVAAVASARSGGAPEQLIEAVADLGAVLGEPGLSPASRRRAALALADAALAVDDVHDDPAVLVGAAEQLDRAAGAPPGGVPVPGLAHLLRARASIAAMHDAPAEAGQHFDAARTELLAASAAGQQVPELFAEIRATQARLIAYRVRGALDDSSGALDDTSEALDQAIELCRAGRHRAVRPWRWATPADLTLARLLVWRALRARSDLPQSATEVHEAVRLSRRQSRPWHSGGTLARLALNEARCARATLRDDTVWVARVEGWQKAAARSARATTAERIRLAAAWVAWAVETDEAAIVAEAYHHLMSIVPLHAATRYRPAAKDRILAAAQEHTEEAGYWLARAHRYRDAVMALEMGRAVKLSEVTRRDGIDPLALDVDYADVTAATADGPVMYVAAAKAGGYALIVAASHDPQFVELPRFSRASIAALLEVFLPDGSGEPQEQAINGGLKWLWDNGMRDLALLRAHGRIVTLIPVGLLSLVPLHAACDPDSSGDPGQPWSHVSQFSAMRYAPNARALRRSRETARQLAGTPVSLLAADVPEGTAPDLNRLRHAAAETAEVARIWRAPAAQLRHRCTWADFREAARDAEVWHLSCHGSANPAAILDSTLHFADVPVTLDQLRTELSAAYRRLAVLSACQSHLTGASNPNEAIGLPSALIQLGFAGVIAAAWPIKELPAAYLMARFYRLWHDEGLEPPVALRAAQQWLRRATPSELSALFPSLIPVMGHIGEQEWRPFKSPVHWAAFAYTGA